MTSNEKPFNFKTFWIGLNSLKTHTLKNNRVHAVAIAILLKDSYNYNVSIVS